MDKKKPKKTVDPVIGELLDTVRSSGDGGAFLLDSDDMALKIRGVITTGCPGLDVAIGRGGIPLGRLSILHGAEGSGKTTIALQIVANCQADDGLAVYMDKEYKLDPDYAVRLGVRKDKLIISQPNSLEELVGGMRKIIAKAGALREKRGRRCPIIIVVDSLNACKSIETINKKIGEQAYPKEAAIWSEQLPEITKAASKQDVGILFISQVRKKFGVLFGDTDEMAGGNAPRFHASLIMKVTRVGTEKEENIKVANKIEVDCKKNQIGAPFRKGIFLIRYGTGVDFESSLLLEAAKAGVIDANKKAGGEEDKGARHYSHDGEKIGFGLAKAAETLRKNTDWRDKINEEFRQKMGWDT